MQPWLLRWDLPVVGELLVSSYFFFLMLGCAVAVEVAIREARRSGEDPREVLLISVATVAAGLVGARLGHFIFVADGLLADPLAVFRVWEGGMVFYGGFLGGMACMLGLVWWRGRSFVRWGDIMAAPVLVGLALGRVGCLANGCCYGRPIDWGTGIEWPWGVTFLRGEVPGVLRGIPLHPTQAYAVINAIALLLVIGWMRRNQRFEGQVFGFVLVAYGLTRSALELFRLDLSRSFWFEDQIGQVVSTSQGISIPLVAVGVAVLVRSHRRAAAVTTAP